MYLKSCIILLIVPLMFFARACGQNDPEPVMKGEEKKSDKMAENKQYKINKSEAEWKEQLSDEEYRILRQKGTEPPFTGDLLHVNEKGTYVCAACGEPLFSSETKFECGSGWPSFYQAIEASKIEEETDTRYGMKRTEILCANCGGHLGHVFPDGPKPTGLRYCTNSAALDFIKKED